MHPASKLTVMAKEIYLHIPKPCHESWDAMTPVEQGRFCKSCCKEVIDFSTLSDKEVLKVLSKNSGSTCGRFTNQQLEKPLLQEVPIAFKPYKFFLSAFIPAFILAGSATAQQMKQGKVVSSHQASVNTNKEEVVVKSLCTLRKQKLTTVAQTTLIGSIKGTVVNDSGEPLSYATIQIRDTHQAVADSLGRFSLAYNGNDFPILLTTSHVGYEQVNTMIMSSEPLNDTLKITMRNTVKLGEVVVIAYPKITCVTRVGAFVAIRRITPLDTLHRFIAKAFGNEMFKVFPNPAVKGADVHITFKEGNYALQLFDNAGKLYLAKEVKSTSTKVSTITLPSNISAGMYYIKTVNSSNRKQFVDKISIQ